MSVKESVLKILEENRERSISGEELAKHLADISMNEQDYSILLRYFSFGLNRLKSYRVQFGQGENCTITTY